MSVKRYFHNGWLEDSEYGDLVHYADYESLSLQLSSSQDQLKVVGDALREAGNELAALSSEYEAYKSVTMMGESDGNYALRSELERVTAERDGATQMLDRLQDLDGFIELTKKLDEHPEGYDGPCLCALCRSYADVVCDKPRPHSGGAE